MKYLHEFRTRELGVLLYRIFLVYFFYQAVRFLFWYYNKDIFPIEGAGEYFQLAFYGIAFDTTAILYTNALFIVLSIVPAVKNTDKWYQKMLFWIYFITNGIALVVNFFDIFYFPFSKVRLTAAVFDVFGHETNVAKIFFSAIENRPSLIVIAILIIILWRFLYRKVKIKQRIPQYKLAYFSLSFISLFIISILAVGGIRGDFKHSTRPINMVDAGKHVRLPEQSSVVLNSTFSFLRTINHNNFKLVHFMDSKQAEALALSYKQYDRVTPSKPNIVIIIVESMGREYCGAFNKHTNIKGYRSFTPFIDSLAQHSLYFSNAYANGRQSIHAMSSILAGIPSLTDAFTSSPYANQKIESVVSVCKDMGYQTSFYHGAPNGSMGFQGFAKILGYDHYYGMNEYNNPKDFDGIWAIWDEPFLQYFAKNVGNKQPFLTTVFTASSHHPFKVPEKYESKFDKGFLEIHKPIQYTDYAIKKYFETASKQSWYQNTIFVIVADHTNQSYYPFYKKALNQFAVPILFFSPNPAYGLKGERTEPAQQMDIYPTLVDLAGYNKAFRSWGRSLASPKNEPYCIVNSNGVTDNFFIENYIYTFDNKDVTGIYGQNDFGLEHNLQTNSIDNAEIDKGKLITKAWFQDYMDRVINRKLN